MSVADTIQFVLDVDFFSRNYRMWVKIAKHLFYGNYKAEWPSFLAFGNYAEREIARFSNSALMFHESELLFPVMILSSILAGNFPITMFSRWLIPMTPLVVSYFCGVESAPKY
uniref:ABC2_membrane domain-containing protein n=1 Tax=Syphacia muris TaxID=451379 RepID=A0A158R3U0_9BILA